MAELIINPHKIRRETGLDLFEDFLFPKLQLASWKMHGPFLLKVGKNTYAFGRMHERGYFQGKVLPTDFKPTYFRAYFLFEPGPEVIHPDASKAIADLCGGESLIAGYDLPVAFYNQLRGKVDLRFKENSCAPQGSVVRVSTEYVEAALNTLREEVGRVASTLVDGLCTDKKAILKEAMKVSGRGRFKLLDKYLQNNGLSAVIVSSPLNVQEIAGVPQKTNRGGVYALYAKDGNEVAVLVTDEAGILRQGDGGILKCAEFSKLIPEGVIGFEDEDLGMGAFIGLGLESRPVKPASSILRDWREEWAGNDLAFYIVAGMATKDAIEMALQETHRRVAEQLPISEADVYGFYTFQLQRFMDNYGVPLTHEVYFANLHSGNRSESPSCFKNYPVTKASNSLKLDTGVKLYDNYGYLRAVSDIARTLCFDEVGKEVYDLLEHTMLEKGIPAAVPGATGEDVYMASCAEINANIPFLRDRGFIPVTIDKLEEVYTRDVGHLLGKEEPANLCFKRGEMSRFKPGMVGCYELQWGYRRYSLGIEDSFAVTEEGPIVFTR
ncbi:MAG TPA: M24 family metallopeptidase [Clostridia bacterium]|nr:M24 family metallopeptidase [Clostridia bacterium]